MASRDEPALRNRAALFANLVYYTPRARHEILSRLGLSTSIKILPKFIYARESDPTETRIISRNLEKLNEIRKKYPLFDEQNAFYYDDNTFYWAQRGTLSFADAWYDWPALLWLKPKQTPSTERQQMVQEIAAWLFEYQSTKHMWTKDRIILCGHSMGGTLSALAWQERYDLQEWQRGLHFKNARVYCFAPFANPWIPELFTRQVNPENMSWIKERINIEYVPGDAVPAFVDSLDNFCTITTTTQKTYAPNPHSALNFVTEEQAEAINATPAIVVVIGSNGYSFT